MHVTTITYYHLFPLTSYWLVISFISSWDLLWSCWFKVCYSPLNLDAQVIPHQILIPMVCQKKIFTPNFHSWEHHFPCSSMVMKELPIPHFRTNPYSYCWWYSPSHDKEIHRKPQAPFSTALGIQLNQFRSCKAIKVQQKNNMKPM